MLTRPVVTASFPAVTIAPSWGLAAHKPTPGDQVQDFAFRGFNGQPHRLPDYSGRSVLLDFGATWCGPCLKEVPVLRQAAELYETRGLQILGMNNDQKVQKARKFLEKNHIPGCSLALKARSRSLTANWVSKGIPIMILIDPQRRIIFILGNGNEVLEGGKLLEKLDEMLPPAPLR